MNHRAFLPAIALALTITACGTATPEVVGQAQGGATLTALRTRPPPPTQQSLAFRTYTVTVLRDGRTLRGFLSNNNEAVPGQPGALKAVYTVDKQSFLAMFPASAATVSSWVPFEFVGGVYSGTIYYGLPATLTLAPDNRVSLKAGTPDPNSLNQGQVVLNLVGQVQANANIVGLTTVADTTPVTSWSGVCAVSLGFCN